MFETTTSDFMYENVTNGTISHGRDEDLARIEVIVQAIILAFAIVGNVCVLVALSRRRKMFSRMHLFILHLSVADLLVAFFNILPQMIWDITHRFQGSDATCRFIKYMQVFVMYLSTYVLVMTAIDRYRAICHPLSNHYWTSRKVYAILAFAYSLSAILSVPQAIIFKYQAIEPGSQTMDCWVDFKPAWTVQLYIIYFTIAVYIIPLGILSFAYGSICWTIWRKYRQNKGSDKSEACDRPFIAKASKSDYVSDKNRSTVNGNIHPRTHSIRGFSKAKMKTIKLTFVVIVAYLICWSPFFISQLWWLYDESAAITSNAMVIMLLMASLNSCCNPWIYLAFSGNLINNLIPCKRFKLSASTTLDSKHIKNSASSSDYSKQHANNIELKHRNANRFMSPTVTTSTRTSIIPKDQEVSPVPSTRRSFRSGAAAEAPDSPHVTKRSRVQQRSANEIEDAQIRWQVNLKSENHDDTDKDIEDDCICSLPKDSDTPLLTDIGDAKCSTDDHDGQWI